MGGKKRSKKKGKKNTQEGALEVVVLGLSHHNAAVDVREKLAIPEASWNEAASSLTAYDGISEAAVLSTCNRFELYLAGANQYECIRDATDFLSNKADGSIDAMTLRKNLFMLSGEDAIWHLLRVSAGLDSLVVGEGQVLSQVKRAHEHGQQAEGSSGKVVSRMLNTAISAGKRVRSETGIAKGAVSISSAAAEFTKMKLANDCNIDAMAESSVCILGAGKMARLLIVHLQTQGVGRVKIVNRSSARVEALRKEFPDLELHYHSPEEMMAVVAAADVVFPATAATEPILHAAALHEALQGRARPGGLQLVDISVPRNVHADCDALEGVHSYNV